MASVSPTIPVVQQPTTPRVNQSHRPRYHFLPAANWMNDPNGLIQWQGVYHMFYQYNPKGPFWAAPHWGHATSTDLIHWHDEPMALVPEVGSYDEEGCWSGCAVDNNGVPTIIYTGVSNGKQRPCLATSSDDLRTWQKYPGNPVVAEPPDLNLVQFRGAVGFRDHSVWREDDTWYQIIGSGIRGVGGAVLLYRSPDLIHWTYMHPLCVGDLTQSEPVWTGPMWECPQLLKIDDHHALVFSVYDGTTSYTVAMTGIYRDHRFTPEVTHKLDYGDNYFYAPQSLTDNQGRVLMWGWLQEGRGFNAQQADGWSGVMSLPRVVSINGNGNVCLAPAPELEMLRSNPQAIGPLIIPADTSVPVNGLRGDSLELHIKIDPGATTNCGIAVRCSGDGSERTLIQFDRESGLIGINAVQASQQYESDNDYRTGPFTLAEGEMLDLRIFVDRSVIEVFANGRAHITGRVYPVRSDSLGVQLLARGGDATLVSLVAWDMIGIWPPTR